MKRTLAIILSALMLLTLVAFSSSAEAGKNADTTITAAYGTPTIDGEVDAIWSTTTASKYDNYDWVAKSSSIYDAGQFRALWDENYLYFLFEINDTTVFTKETARSSAFLKDWYKGDGIALSFAADRTNTNANNSSSIWMIVKPWGVFANYSADNHEVAISEVSSAAWATLDKTYVQNDFVNLSDADRMYATKVTETGYVIEMKINLGASKYDAIKNIKIAAGEKIAFDTWLYANDKTDSLSRDHVYTWADKTCNTSKDNTLKGTLELLPKSTPATGDNAVVFAVVAAVALMGSAIVVVKKHN